MAGDILDERVPWPPGVGQRVGAPDGRTATIVEIRPGPAGDRYVVNYDIYADSSVPVQYSDPDETREYDLDEIDRFG